MQSSTISTNNKANELISSGKSANKEFSIPKNVREIILTTNLPEEYQIEKNSLSIPSNYDKESLNKLVKKLLKLTSSEKSFNFFIENKILDKPLHNFLLENPEILKEAEEKPIEISYSFQLDEPKLINTIKEDEWIRKISIRKNANLKSELEYFCVGLFNGEVSFYDKTQQKIFKVCDGEAAEDNFCEMLHDIAFFNTQAKENILLKAARTENYNAQIYHVDLNKASATQIYYIAKANNEYVNCFAVNSVDPNFFCAADTAGALKIYKLPEQSQIDSLLSKFEEKNNAKKSAKKRKIEAYNLAAELALENCHENREIKHVAWLNNQQILTAGEDFHMKVWNIHTKTNYLSINTQHKLTSSICHFSPESLISGHDDGKIKFWDLRNGKISNIFLGHSNYISALDFDGEDYSKFISTAYDGLVNIWDVRSNKSPIYSLRTDSEKNYGLAYNTADYIIAGGDSSNINIFSTKA